MARHPRFILPVQPQHVIERGNNRQPIFCRARDHAFYLEKLMQAANEHDCPLHAYVQMTNHVHLLVSPARQDGLDKMMQMLGRYYVQYFNYNYHRTGTLWEGRYKASLISSEQYLFTCMRYIELNPVRALIYCCWAKAPDTHINLFNLLRHSFIIHYSIKIKNEGSRHEDNPISSSIVN